MRRASFLGKTQTENLRSMQSGIFLWSDGCGLLVRGYPPVGYGARGNCSALSRLSLPELSGKVRREEWGTNLKEVKRFLIVIEQTDSGYSSYSLDPPGCVSTGKTREEAERNMRDAIEFHADGLQ
jgi:hypothetical protein